MEPLARYRIGLAAECETREAAPRGGTSRSFLSLKERAEVPGFLAN